MIKISKISLGTAQLGMDYGISNKNGKPNINSAINILNYAWKSGINTFDTAPIYGSSEKILGTFISSNVKNKDNLIISSKLPEIKINEKFTLEKLTNYIKSQINQSLQNLHIKTIPIYLLHHASDIDKTEGLIIECLNQIKKEGLIKRFGISAYHPREVELSLNFKEIDVIQVPINIFDQRLIQEGLLKRLRRKDYTIFARSIYLQGLFFLDPNNLPTSLKVAKEPLLKLLKISKKHQIDIQKLAFLFIRDLFEISSLIIGIEKLDQLKANLSILNEKSLSTEIYEEIREDFFDLPEKLINPSLWKTKKN